MSSNLLRSCGLSSGTGASPFSSIKLTFSPTSHYVRRWKADQATWAANEHLGECSRIIEEFEQAAEIEGRNLSAANGVILLNEAAAAGWGRVR